MRTRHDPDCDSAGFARIRAVGKRYSRIQHFTVSRWAARGGTGLRGDSALRCNIVYEPTRSGATKPLRQAMTLRAVMRPVRGFSDGTFSIVMLNRVLSASTSIV